MSAKQTQAVLAARRAGIAVTVHDLGDDGVPDDERGYGLAAAAAMETGAERVYKTILVKHDSLAVAVVPVTTTVDLKAMAKALGVKKVEVANPAEAERVTGYVVGGISPLGQKKRLPTVLDQTALDHSTIFVSAGRRGLELELTAQDLVKATSATVAPIGRE